MLITPPFSFAITFLIIIQLSPALLKAALSTADNGFQHSS